MDAPWSQEAPAEERFAWEGPWPEDPDRRVHVSVRGNSVRIAPHLFIDGGDGDRLLEVLADFAP